MPFLNYEQFETIVGRDAARQLTANTSSFTAANASVADLITQHTGVAAPADATTSPGWAQEAAATLIYCKRAPFMPDVSEETRKAIAALYTRTIEELKLKVGRPADEQGAEVGDIGGQKAW